MDINFEKALEFCLRWEGGNDDDPDDYGGRTSRGITQSEYNRYRSLRGEKHRDVWTASDAEVRDIYYHNYYLAAHCDAIAEFAPKLAIAVYDWGVNAGIHRGIQTLQEICGSTPDGICGKQTLNDIKAAVAKRGEKAMLIRYQRQRHATYVRWAAGSQEKFLGGWLNRCNDLSKLLIGQAV